LGSMLTEKTRRRSPGHRRTHRREPIPRRDTPRHNLLC
jgi:hypothetical protein